MMIKNTTWINNAFKFIKRSYSNSNVCIVEVGPRDGLQNEKQFVSTKTKIELLDKLSQCNFSKIEATSFVSPKWIPQMKDNMEVMAGIKRNPNTQYCALTPNIKGFQSAISCGVSEVAIFGAASETFSKTNINCSINESIERFKVVIDAANSNNIPIRGYVSCVIACPYEGPVKSGAVVDVTERMLDLGCYEVSLGDTIGVGTPGSFKTLLKDVSTRIPSKHLALHCHDTYGQALANILTGLDMDIRTFDSSVAGLGGCPYAKGASGNVATEDVVYMMNGIGLETGINLNELVKVGDFISKYLNRPYLSKAGLALLQKQ